MRIAFIGPAYPYRGGIANFGMRLARELAPHHDCLYINFTRLYPAFLFPGKTQFDRSRDKIDFPNKRIIDSVSPFSWRRAARVIRDWRADTIVFHWWHPFFAPAYRGVMTFLNRPIVKTAICHNVYPHDQFGIWHRLSRATLPHMDGCVIHSRSELQDLTGLGQNIRHLTLFHPLYDIFPGEDTPREVAREKLGLPRDKRIVLDFGLIRPYKGVDVLLDACRRLEDMKNLQCLVVGEIYKGREELMEQVNRFPPERVKLIDRYIPNEEVALWFRAADLVVLPYRSATQSGIIPIAYRCRRPVIATRVGGLPDMINEGSSGYLVEPADPTGLASAIRSYFEELGSPDLTDGILAISKRLSWEEYASRLTAFVGQLSSERLADA